MDLRLLKFNDFLASYAKQYAFETTLVPPNYYKTGVGTCYRCVAVNIGSPTLEMFEAMWDVKCPNCPPSLTSGGFIGCNQCNGTGYIEPYDLAIAFVRRKDKLWHVKLFSYRDDVDCGVICCPFNGSGEKTKGFFICSKLPFEY